MSEQEVFNTLSELEEYFFYRMQNPGGLPFSVLTEMHEEAKTMLHQWHNLTGCNNESPPPAAPPVAG